jgi:hypothetical protein
MSDSLSEGFLCLLQKQREAAENCSLVSIPKSGHGSAQSSEVGQLVTVAVPSRHSSFQLLDGLRRPEAPGGVNHRCVITQLLLNSGAKT